MRWLSYTTDSRRDLKPEISSWRARSLRICDSQLSRSTPSRRPPQHSFRLETRRNRNPCTRLTFSNVIKRAKPSSIGHVRRVQIAQNLSNHDEILRSAKRSRRPPTP